MHKGIDLCNHHSNGPRAQRGGGEGANGGVGGEGAEGGGVSRGRGMLYHVVPAASRTAAASIDLCARRSRMSGRGARGRVGEWARGGEVLGTVQPGPSVCRLKTGPKTNLNVK